MWREAPTAATFSDTGNKSHVRTLTQESILYTHASIQYIQGASTLPTSGDTGSFTENIFDRYQFDHRAITVTVYLLCHHGIKMLGHAEMVNLPAVAKIHYLAPANFQTLTHQAEID